jgi:hypothetical protein
VINVMQMARYREGILRRGQKRAGEAHVLADMVRTDAYRLRTVAGDTGQAEEIEWLSRPDRDLCP